jgi:hypothetical protein
MYIQQLVYVMQSSKLKVNSASCWSYFTIFQREVEVCGVNAR